MHNAIKMAKLVRVLDIDEPSTRLGSPEIFYRVLGSHPTWCLATRFDFCLNSSRVLDNTSSSTIMYYYLLFHIYFTFMLLWVWFHCSTQNLILGISTTRSDTNSPNWVWLDLKCYSARSKMLLGSIHGSIWNAIRLDCKWCDRVRLDQKCYSHYSVRL